MAKQIFPQIFEIGTFWKKQWESKRTHSQAIWILIGDEETASTNNWKALGLGKLLAKKLMTCHI